MEEERSGGRSWLMPIMALLLILILGAGAYFFFGSNKMENNADLANDNVASVATVNGVTIPKAAYDAQLNAAVASYKAQGVDVTSPEKLSLIQQQTLSNLINDVLLSQNISAAGIKSNPEDVEKQFQLLLTQSGGEDAFKAQLAQNNLTEEQLRENISKQLAAQAYLAQNVDLSSVSASDDEIKQFYAEYSKAQKDSGQTVPALKDLSDQIKQQIISNKQQAMIGEFIASLQSKAKIEITAGAI